MQFAFVAGRNILGSSLRAHELARGYREETRDMPCAINVDLRKAYVSLCWDFLEEVNDKKSYLYFSGGTDLLKHETLQKIGCQEGELPVKYLGIPLSSTRNYLWRGKNEGSKEIVAWKDICLSKNEDKAVLGKQLWKVISKLTDSRWAPSSISISDSDIRRALVVNEVWKDLDEGC
ncbi:hypothetical protein GOBAR_AA04076 [Gossypium barbadense]|uniref:Uncharacterized protein n=1 Tax=Gossypium barbadense TaxID=3634 RepID=A0A2P5YLM0_GOSBA|nr:hypothetical protein GOBAR_AA04076 [Gossypium barbadense]